MTAMASLQRGLMRHNGWMLGVESIALIVGAVLRIGDLDAFAALLRSARPGWLLVVLLLQTTT